MRRRTPIVAGCVSFISRSDVYGFSAVLSNAFYL
jgi:hypothetical protein